jgi:hypothetical protein
VLRCRIDAAREKQCRCAAALPSNLHAAAMCLQIPSHPLMRRRTRHGPVPREGQSLIDWSEPASHSGVLDWRERAHDFGLIPAEDGGEVDGPLVEPVDQRLAEEEPEAFQEQQLEITPHELSPEEIAESPVAGVSHDD